MTSTPEKPPGLVSPAKLAAHEKHPPLGLVTTPTVATGAAAYYLNRQPQTLRGWASADSAPPGLRPVRINGRLAWPVAEIKRLLGMEG